MTNRGLTRPALMLPPNGTDEFRPTAIRFRAIRNREDLLARGASLPVWWRFFSPHWQV